MEEKILCVVGLGYVGLPLAVAFSKKMKVIGFDINKNKIEKYKKGIDCTNEIGKKLKDVKIEFTTDEKNIKRADFIIVAIPTPIDRYNKPNLSPIISATEIVAKNMKKGSLIIYESTVYPGLTEEICIPILEQESGFICKRDFSVGYSPERINPGDKIHRLENIKKIVSGIDEDTLEKVKILYEEIIEAGVHPVSSIKVAEAAKIIENSQRDINIAFVNELSIIFNKMGIDTNEVLNAACTKWNFLNFRPGLVGGHCIGVDPYYLTYKSEELGYIPEVILSGRRINDNMGKYIANCIVKEMIKNNIPIRNSRVLIKGITFKEDVPDIRNSKVIEIIKELKEFYIDVLVEDYMADKNEVFNEYGISLNEKVNNVDTIVFAVSHEKYINTSPEEVKSILKDERNLIFDIKAKLNKAYFEEKGLKVWRL